MDAQKFKDFRIRKMTPALHSDIRLLAVLWQTTMENVILSLLEAGTTHALEMEKKEKALP